MEQIEIVSTDKNDTPGDIEEKLLKAAKAVQLKRENKQFTDVFLKERKDKSTEIFRKVINNMMDEISEVLVNNKGGKST